MKKKERDHSSITCRERINKFFKILNEFLKNEENY